MYRPFLALRYLLTRPINLLGVGGVTIGVWALIVVVSIFSGFLSVVGEHVRSASADISVLFLPDDADYALLRREIEADPNVASSAPRIVHFGLLHRPGDRPPPPPLLGRGALQGGDTPFLFVLGVDTGRERRTTGFQEWLSVVQPELRVRDLSEPLAPIDDLPGILIGEQRMIQSGLRPGDLVVLNTARNHFGPRGQQGIEQVDVIDPASGERGAPAFRVAGAYRTRHVGYDGNNAFVDIRVLRQLLDLPDGSAQEIAVRVHDDSTTDATAERVKSAVRRTLGLEHSPSNRGASAWTWRQRHRGFLSGIEWQRSLMKIVLIVIMATAAVLMFATLSMMVAEKTGDIGILTAMGATPRGVMFVFLACGLAITMIGICLGIVAGCLSAIYLEEFRQFILSLSGVDLFPVKVYNLDRVPHELDPLWILQVTGMAVAVGIVVSAIPALRAARHNPLVSLRGI